MELPPERRQRWLLRGAARLLEGGAEPVRGLVVPTPAFFPDAFDRSPAAVERLLGRVCEHAGLADLPVALELSGAGGGSGGGCSTGGCCGSGTGAGGPPQRVRRAAGGDGYVVAVGAGEIGNPTVLTTGLVRAVAHLFLLEADLYAEFQRPEYEQVVDLAGVLLGFGVLLANGAYLYSKGCGGVHIASATVLPVEEVALGLAMFCHLHAIPARSARAHLETTPRAAFDEARLWVRSNAGIVGLARTDRASLEADAYGLSEARGWLARVLGLGRARGPSVPTDAELDRVAESIAATREQAGPDPARQRLLAELRELVDEALER